MSHDAVEFVLKAVEMVAEHGFDRAALVDLFTAVERQDRIIELMTRPAEKSKPWHEYREIFLTEKRTRQGVEFWRENEASLQRASQS